MESEPQLFGSESVLPNKSPLPPEAEGVAPDRRLEVTVIFTSLGPTISAVQQAGNLLRGLDGRISLVFVQPVPLPLEIQRPAVSLDFLKSRLLTVASASPVETTADLYLCRTRLDALVRVLSPNQTVVIGYRKRMWPSWEKKLAKKLQVAGYRVILFDFR